MGKIRTAKKRILTKEDIANLAEEYSNDIVSYTDFHDRKEYLTESIMMMDDAKSVLEWLTHKYNVYFSNGNN